MKKFLKASFLAYAVVLISVSAIAQDTIYMVNKEKMVSIVTEISENDVRFKEFSNPTGPDFIIKKSAIDHIVFKNGDHKQFIKEKRIIPYGRNVISYHLLDLAYRDFTFSYEHILKNGKIGFKVPFAVGFNNDSETNGPYSYKNLAYTGMGLNVYVMGQRMASYFMGPEIQFGVGEENTYNYDEYYTYYTETEFFYGRLLINNGIAFSPVPNLRLTSILGVGIRYYDVPDSEDSGLQSTAYFTFTMGYRF
jgi:hypothetical protein